MKRALLFGAGLLLLWVALQLLPANTPPQEPAVYSDEAGTVAARPEAQQRQTPSMVTPGFIAAFLLLAGAGAFAYYLRRKSSDEPKAAPITPLGAFNIGPSQSLRLVECGDEILLIGVTSGQINLLRSYPTDRFEHLTSDLASKAAGGGSHFADVLHQFAGRRGLVETNGTAS